METQFITQFLTLLIIYQGKHFLADFPLQRGFMLKKVNAGWDFVVPLAVHCAVHAGLSLVIIMVVNPALWWLAVVDFCSHFIMDRLKSGPRYLGRFKDRNTNAYWTCFGLDQMVHHLTHYFIVWKLVTSGIS